MTLEAINVRNQFQGSVREIIRGNVSSVATMRSANTLGSTRTVPRSVWREPLVP